MILGAQATLRDARDGVRFAEIDNPRQPDRAQRIAVADQTRIGRVVETLALACFKNPTICASLNRFFLMFVLSSESGRY